MKYLQFGFSFVMFLLTFGLSIFTMWTAHYPALFLFFCSTVWFAYWTERLAVEIDTERKLKNTYLITNPPSRKVKN